MKIARFAINTLFWLCMAAVVFLCLQIFLFSSFKIPSDSMEPGLVTGDNVLVNKAVYGARLFDLGEALNGGKVEVYRVPGIGRIRHNDVVVFHFPHPNSWDRIEMHLMKYFIKRCIGLPGDTLRIADGFYVNSNVTQVGNAVSQGRVSGRDENSFEKGVYNCFPYDSILGWNIQHFGPLYIPKKGDTVTLDTANYKLYKKLIEWELQAPLVYTGSTMPYQFRHNYYFMAGDRVEDSQDSRYWGLLPEDYIVGKAWIIWKSTDPYSGKFRWKRFLKQIE